MKSKICKVWGKSFIPTGKHHKICSDKCRKIARKQSQTKWQKSERGKLSNKKCKEKYRNTANGRLKEKIYAEKYKPNKHLTCLCKKFNITKEQYLKMIKDQDNKCAICSNPETKTYKGSIQNLSLDHNAATGKIRGLLCDRCNRGIGIFEHNPTLLLLAKNYLMKHRVISNIEIYLSHSIRGIYGVKATIEQMNLNCEKAILFTNWFRANFPSIILYCPAEYEKWVQTAYMHRIITEKQILDIDCEILKNCKALLVYSPDNYISRGMQTEINFAEENKIPIFYENSTYLYSKTNLPTIKGKEKLSNFIKGLHNAKSE